MQPNSDKLPAGLIWISWESCLIRYCLLQFREIFTFRSPEDVQVQSECGASFRCVVNPRVVFLGVWWHKGWLVVLDGGLSSDAEDSSSGSVFSSK